MAAKKTGTAKDATGNGTDVTIRVRNGRPTVCHGASPVSAAVYCDYILRGDWDDRNLDFVKSGVKVYHLTQPHGTQGGGEDYFDNALWMGDGVYPDDDHAFEYNFDRQAGAILHMEPEARFFIKFNLSVPKKWADKYPGEIMTDEGGKRYREASWSSERFLADLARYAARVVEYCESRPWGDRILGYMGLPYGEGCTIHTINGNYFDVSPANETAFRAFVKRTYRTLPRLRQAWNDRTLTWNTVRIPRDSEWLRRRREAEATIGGVPLSESGFATNSGQRPKGLFHFIEADNAVREHDYCRFMRGNFQAWIRTVARAVKGAAAKARRKRLMTFDITKQPLLGWAIQSNFDGIGDARDFPNILTLSGSWDVASLLDDPLIDGLWTPADYTARTLGFAFEPEGLSDSLVLRGKLMFCENDTRNYVGAGINDQGAFRTDAEVEAGLLRNEAMAMTRGYQNYWCNIGTSYFHAPGIQKTVKKITSMLDRLQDHPHVETRDAIAFVIDDESTLHEDFTSGYQALSVIWQRVRGLAHCGVPYRVLLLSDLQKKELPDYRTWLFPNLFRVDADVLRLLHAKVLRNGNVALFGPATGITDGRHLGADGASQLLGVPFELHPRSTVRHVVVHDFGHAISRELPANFIYGDSLPYGPTLTPADRAVENHGGVPLGHANLCWFIHRTGLFVKDFGRGAAGNGRGGPRGKDDYAVVWSAAMPLPENLLRACARYAGSTIWCEDSDVVYASGSLVALHGMKAGARVIHLPRACRVADAVTGRLVSRGPVKEIRFTIRPPETRIFTLD